MSNGLLGVVFNHRHAGLARSAKIEHADMMLLHKAGNVLPCDGGGNGLHVYQQKGLVFFQASFERERGAAVKLDLGIINDNGGIAVLHILARALAITRVRQRDNGVVRGDDAVFCAAVFGTPTAAGDGMSQRSTVWMPPCTGCCGGVT